MTTNLTFLEMGRLALDSIYRYEFQYQMKEEKLVEYLQKTKNILSAANATFGNAVMLLRSGYLNSIQFLRMCDRIDETVNKISVCNQENKEELHNYYEDLMDLCLKSYDAVKYIEDAGSYEYDEESDTEKFLFDPELIREQLIAESGKKGTYDRKSRKQLRKMSKKCSDEMLMILLQTATDLNVKELKKMLGDKDIRLAKSPVELFIRERYSIPDRLIYILRDVVEDSVNVLLYNKYREKHRQQRFDTLQRMKAPLVILFNEQRILYEYKMIRKLAEYVNSLEQPDEETVRFVTDTYLKFNEIQIRDECRLTEKECLTAYRTYAEEALNEITVPSAA